MQCLVPIRVTFLLRKLTKNPHEYKLYARFSSFLILSLFVIVFCSVLFGNLFCSSNSVDISHLFSFHYFYPFHFRRFRRSNSSAFWNWVFFRHTDHLSHSFTMNVYLFQPNRRHLLSILRYTMCTFSPSEKRFCLRFFLSLSCLHFLGWLLCS